MIDINELRQSLGAVQPEEVSELLDRLEAAESALSNLGVTPEEAKEGLARHKATLARLEAAENAVTEAYQRGYSTGREEIEKERDALRAAVQHEADCVEAAKDEIEALRTKIEQMEKQEPYCWTTSPPSGHYSRFNPEVDRWIENGWNVVPLYALPGAQPAPKLHIGNLPTVNQDAYPALGTWWVQLWDGDSVFARVYGASPEEARSRAVMLAAAPEAKS